MQSQRVVWAGVLFAALLALAGCSGREGTVRGTVKLDGQPVAEGAITFIPADGNTGTAGGAIKGGKYSVGKVPPGPKKVQITVPKVVGKKKIYPTADSPEMPVTVEALPARYNEKTELTLDVKAGANEKDWDLQSK